MKLTDSMKQYEITNKTIWLDPHIDMQIQKIFHSKSLLALWQNNPKSDFSNFQTSLLNSIK